MNLLLSFAGTALISLLGAHSTYWLAHRKKMNVIRAASLASLVFVGVAKASGAPALLSQQAAFFGSTFVAMSEPYRLSEGKVLLASFVFAMILFVLQRIDFLHYHGGMGGTLGGTAFLACILVYWIQWLTQVLMRTWRRSFAALAK